MRSRVKGDFSVLESWTRLLKNAPKLLSDMSANMAEETISLIRDGWRSQADPYGDPWQKKKVDDGRQILVGRTARLRNGWHVVKSGKGGWKVAPSVVYAAAHQDPQKRRGWGTRPGSLDRLPRRMMIPSRSRGLPKAWSRAYRELAEETLREHFSRGGGAGMGLVTGKIAGPKRRFNVMALIRRAIRETQGGGESGGT